MGNDTILKEEFFRLLYSDPEFLSELGKVALSAGMLEVELIKYLEKNGVKRIKPRSTLGSLINIIENNGILRSNDVVALKEVSQQRNYLIHNLYALFSGKIEETVLPREGLIELDVQLYIVKAQELNVNLFGLARIFRKYSENT